MGLGSVIILPTPEKIEKTWRNTGVTFGTMHSVPLDLSSKNQKDRTSSHIYGSNEVTYLVPRLAP